MYAVIQNASLQHFNAKKAWQVQVDQFKISKYLRRLFFWVTKHFCSLGFSIRIPRPQCKSKGIQPRPPQVANMCQNMVLVIRVMLKNSVTQILELTFSWLYLGLLRWMMADESKRSQHFTLWIHWTYHRRSRISSVTWRHRHLSNYKTAWANYKEYFETIKQ